MSLADICLKEVPIGVHYCGMECFNKWKKQKQSLQQDDE